MKHSALLYLACLLGPLSLSGCSSNFGDVATASARTAIGTIKGNLHGGQQPIAGAKIFLLATGTSAYGGSSTPILTGTGLSDTYGFYVLTDANGNFNISGDYTCLAGKDVLYLYSIGGNPGGGTNASASLLAVLGLCPSDGTFADHVSFVYMNEVSTVAAAIAFAPFSAGASTTPERNVGIGPPQGSSTGTPPSAQAFLDIATAASNAALLYNINGSPFSLSAGATLPAYAPFATANVNTPSSTSTNYGTVPQALIHTIANVLAACVNSGATITPGSTTVPTTTCTNLFNATKQGTLVPANTAAAAFFIAQHPADPGGGGTPTYVSTIYNLAGTDPVFSPALTTAPYDFTAAIQYVAPNLTSTSDIEIDGANNAWVTSPTNGKLVEINPLGVASSYNQPSTNYIAIDSSLATTNPAGNGDVWTTSGTFGVLYEVGNTGTGPSASGTAYPWIPSFNSQSIVNDGTYNYVSDFTNTRIVRTADASPGSVITFSSSTMTGTWNSLALDVVGNNAMFTAGTQSGSASACRTFLTQNTAGTALTGTCTSLPLVSTFVTPGKIAVDSFSNAWLTDTASGGSGLSQLSTNSGTAHHYTSGGLLQPLGVAVDGGGLVWVTNTGAITFGTSGSTTTCTGCTLSAYTTSSTLGSSSAVSPPLIGTTGTSYYDPSGGYVSGNQSAGNLGYKALAIDGAGDIWITNSAVTAGAGVTEIIGIASPTVTPLTLAVLNGSIGKTP